MSDGKEHLEYDNDSGADLNGLLIRNAGTPVKAGKDTGCKNLTILTWDYESQEHVPQSIEILRYGNGYWKRRNK